MSTYWADRFKLGTGPVPVAPCVDPAHFELERDRIFRKTWLKIARVEEIPKAGDYIVKELEVVGASLILLRGADDKLRVFHNVCRHRGNRLVGGCVGKPKGRTKGFACNFHGWTWDLEGKLVNVPDEGEFVDLEKSTLGLVPVNADVWQGFIFVNFDSEPKETLLEYLAEIARDTDGYPFGAMDPVVEYSIELNANWKVWLDAFQEGYHVPFVHSSAVPSGFVEDFAALAHLDSLRVFENHRGLSVPGNPMFQPVPTEAEILKHDWTATHGQAIAKEQQPRGVNPDNIPSWHADIHVVFPNLLLFPSGGWWFTYSYWPLAVDRTRCEARIYRPKPKTGADLLADEYSRIVWRDAISEDFSRLEDVQAMLSSGALQEMTLSDQEVLVRHAHEVVERHIRD